MTIRHDDAVAAAILTFALLCRRRIETPMGAHLPELVHKDEISRQRPR
jgi:hypothetical protein